MKSLNLTTEEKSKYQINDNEITDEAGIPNFWLNAIKNSKYFALNDKDELVLAHLKDVKLNLNADKLDYSIDFIFDKNEFFEHEKLSLHFTYDDKKFEPIRLTGSNIVWSSREKNPSLKIKTKKVKSKIY